MTIGDQPAFPDLGRLTESVGMTYRQWSIVILASGYAAHPHLMERGSTAIEIEEWASGLSKAIIARMDKEKGDK